MLGWKSGTLSVLLYLLLGMVGLPVFSGFSGGFVKLAGPTGGYLIGYVPLALVSGLLLTLSEKIRFGSGRTGAEHTEAKSGKAFDLIVRRLTEFAGMLLGTAVLYALGTAWFCILMDSTVSRALGLCVIPFIPGDLIKMLIALLIGPEIRRRIK